MITIELSQKEYNDLYFAVGHAKSDIENRLRNKKLNYKQKKDLNDLYLRLEDIGRDIFPASKVKL